MTNCRHVRRSNRRAATQGIIDGLAGWSNRILALVVALREQFWSVSACAERSVLLRQRGAAENSLLGYSVWRERQCDTSVGWYVKNDDNMLTVYVLWHET